MGQQPSKNSNIPKLPITTKLVLFDFDLTALHIHTGGCVERGAINQVGRNLNQTFLEKVKYCHEHGIPVGIVSFGDDNSAAINGVNGGKSHIAGKYMIQKVLETQLNTRLVDSIYIVAFYNETPMRNMGSLVRKNPHINMVIRAINNDISAKKVFAFENSPEEREDFFTRTNTNVDDFSNKNMITDYREVVYFDDDGKNIQAAKINFPGIRAVHINDTQTGFNQRKWEEAFRL
jgi:hypothetical protein